MLILAEKPLLEIEGVGITTGTNLDVLIVVVRVGTFKDIYSRGRALCLDLTNSKTSPCHEP